MGLVNLPSPNNSEGGLVASDAGKDASRASASPVILKKVQFALDSGYANLYVCVLEGADHFTNARVARAACELCPDIAYHACVNAQGAHFASVIEHTSVLHLFEHVLVDVLVDDAAHKSKQGDAACVRDIYSAATKYTSKDRSSAIIKLTITSDIELAYAINRALDIMDKIFAS